MIALAAGSLRGAAPGGAVDFTPHDIDANFSGGYSVSVADFNKDGKIDVIANSLQAQELAWYENPSWERHVIVAETQQIVNQAMTDIDGDGIPEVAFQSSFAMQAGQQRRAQLDRATATAIRASRGRCRRSISSRPRITSPGPTSTATARRNC